VSKVKKILIISNATGGLYNFRRELIDALILKNRLIILSSSYLHSDYFKEKGADFNFVKLSRTSVNPFNDILLLYRYWKIIKKYNPDLILTYTIKPNIYGGLAARLTKTPYLQLWKPMHLQPLYSHYDYVGTSIEDTLFECGICLPSDTKMTKKCLKTLVKLFKGLW